MMHYDNFKVAGYNSSLCTALSLGDPSQLTPYNDMLLQFAQLTQQQAAAAAVAAQQHGVGGATADKNNAGSPQVCAAAPCALPQLLGTRS